MDLIQSVLNGEKRGIAKMITLIEKNTPEAIEALKQIYQHTGKAAIIGITGPPGSGKSSLVNQLTKKIRSEDKKVGIIAIDPTSPFTGGALLGDRIRMQELALDQGVFIRSMGSRGALGGLSRASYDAAKVLDAAGMDYVIIETVGVGQSEIDIVKLADIVALVLIPGMGDEVQAIKAGVMEIGDVFVVNKADKDGANRVVTEIEMMLDLNTEKDAARPPVIKTIATTGEGIDELNEHIKKYWHQIANSNELAKRRKERIRSELISITEDHILNQILSDKSSKIDSMVKDIYEKKIDPYSAMELLIAPEK